MGIRSGMKFSFYTSETEFLDVFDHMEPWTGFRLVISDNDTDVSVDEDGKLYGLGQFIQIGLKKELFKSTTRKPWSRCTSNYPPQFMELQQKLNKHHYSKNNCLWSCFMNRTIITNNCIPYIFEEWVPMGKAFPDLRPCSTEESMGNFFEGMTACQNYCLPACEHVTWLAHPLTEPMPSILEVNKVHAILNSFNITKASYSTVAIFFSDMNVIKTIEEPAKLPEDIFGDIGGQLGLWSGMSIMTVVELCIIINACLKRRLTNVGSRDHNIVHVGTNS